jgi:hypothetical protein
VLKALQLPADDAASAFNSSDHPAHWNYWRREALVYTSGLLDALPDGLAAPRCFATSEPAPETVWLWLEDIVGSPATAWSLDRFGRAARRLGRFQGAYAAGAKSLPDAPWLSHSWLRAWVPDARTAMLDLVRDPAAWRHPLLRGAFPPGAAAAVERLWEAREALLAAVERAPRTLCHLDVWPRNLFARHDTRHGDETVLLDWSQTGEGAIAEDIANLVLDSVWMQLVESAALPAFEQVALDGYLEGLRDAGWTGPAGTMRATYATVGALRFGLLAGQLLAIARDEEQHATLEWKYGRPAAAVIASRAATVGHELVLAEEIRSRPQ